MHSVTDSLAQESLPQALLLGNLTQDNGNFPYLSLELYLLVKHPVNLSLMLKLHCLLFEVVTIIKTVKLVEQ